MAEWNPDLTREQMPAELLALLPEDLAGIRAAYEQTQADWDALVERARVLPDERLHESVDGEWSFVRTLRHLVYAHDCWIGRMVRGDDQPFHRWGQPFAEWPEAWKTLELDLDAEPSLDEVLDVLAQRRRWVREVLADLDDAGLDRVCEPDDSTFPRDPHTVRQCLWTVIEEPWWHLRFARRDLDRLSDG
jgi:hypothetical protein